MVPGKIFVSVKFSILAISEIERGRERENIRKEKQTKDKSVNDLLIKLSSFLQY